MFMLIALTGCLDAAAVAMATTGLDKGRQILCTLHMQGLLWKSEQHILPAGHAGGLTTIPRGI